MPVLIAQIRRRSRPAAKRVATRDLEFDDIRTRIRKEFAAVGSGDPGRVIDDPQIL